MTHFYDIIMIFLFKEKISVKYILKKSIFKSKDYMNFLLIILGLNNESNYSDVNQYQF